MLTLIASAAGDPTVQQVLIEKGALDLTVALLSERHQRTKEQHERVTLAGVYDSTCLTASWRSGLRLGACRRLEV